MASISSARYIAPMNRETGRIARATLLIVISALSFGSISVLTVLITRTGIPLIAAMAWRFVLGAIVLAFVVDLRVLRSVPAKRAIQLLLVGVFGQTLVTFVSLYALDYIGVGPLAFLFYPYPAWVALIAAVRKTETLTPLRITALVAALLGVTVMVGAPMAEHLNPIGVLLALASALLYSAYLPILEHLQRDVPALVVTFLLVVGAALSFVAVSIFSGKLVLRVQPLAGFEIILLALVSTVIAFTSLIKGLSVLGPVRTSIIATVEPFFTVVLGVIVLGNEFSATTIAGGILIAGAILLIEWSSTAVEATA